MNYVEISVPDGAIERAEAVLAGIPGGVERAVSAALNRGLTTAQSESQKQITQVYDITKTTVRHKGIFEMRKATQGSLVGSITFSGHRIPLYNFGVTPKTPTSTGARVPVNLGNRWVMASPGAVVRARIRRDSTKTPSGRAFIAQMRSGHVGVFERTGNKSRAIRERYGPSVAQMAGNSVVQDVVSQKAIETIDKRVEHEITRILSGWGG